jgi:hypothetical protein
VIEFVRRHTLMAENEAPKEGTPGEHNQQPSKDEPEYPAFLDYLETPQGHELASRVVSLFEGIQKATIEAGVEQKRREVEFQHSTMRSG